MKLKSLLLCLIVIIIAGCQQTVNSDKDMVVQNNEGDNSNSQNEDDSQTEPKIYNNNIYEDEDGNKWYFEEGTYDLVETNKNFNELDRITIENQDILNCLQTEQHNEFWIVKNGYLLIDNNEDWFYYMNLKNMQVNAILLNRGYVNYSDFEAILNNNGDMIFSTSMERFVNSYPKYNVVYNEDYYEYEGIAYYEDNSEISLGADEIIESHDDILPVSESPQFTFDGEIITVSDSKKIDGVDYYRILENGWVGLIHDEIFEPIIENDVREYIVSDYGFVYLEFDERSNIISLQHKGLKVEFNEILPVDSIVVKGKWLYYIIDSKFLKRLDLSLMIPNEYEEIAPEDLYDLEMLAGKTVMDLYGERYNFNLEGNEDYLIAYDKSNCKILVFDNADEIKEVLNSSFVHLTEDSKVIMNVLAFLARHDIEQGVDEILGEYYFVSRDMIFNDYLIYCTPYEGPSFTKAIDISKVAVNPFESYPGYDNDIDYSIEIGNSHQSYIIIYDYLLRKIELFDVVYIRPEYELTGDGLRYWIDIDDYIDGGFIPLRKGSKVQVYWTKRT
jgi:hypothetical protein